ncbi:MAG: hypothetical protein HeimC3_45980 [Candidatus Heimdallarchaeota archaeon LC_3]|nr:MAG: hypothetical protein HeimC3_45980 [Candidatus Heimdallarchaeota archaeon LC_3]
MSLLKNQFRQIILIISVFYFLIVGYIIVVGIAYPGSEGFRELLEALENPALEIFKNFFFLDLLRFINLDQFFFGLWIQMSLVTILPLILLAFGLFLGVELITHDQANKTLDIIFSLPISNTKYFLIRSTGSILYITVACIIGLLSTYLTSVYANFNINLDSILQVWFIIFLQTIFGLFLGSFIGTVYFNRTFGLQLSFLFLGLSYTLTILLNVLENIEFLLNLINIIKIFSIFNYLQYVDIIFAKNFKLEAFAPMIFGIAFLFIVSLYLFRKRDIIDSDLPPIYLHILKIFPLQIKKRLITSNNSYSISRISTYWVLRLRSRFPIFSDELWSKGVTITLFSGMVFLSIFIQLILYPGDEGAKEIISAFQYSPFYVLFARGFNLTDVPYLGYSIAQLFAFLPLIFLPYIVYSFIYLELRDQNKTEELLLSYPISNRNIFVWRTIAAIFEYYFIVVVVIISILIPEILLGQLKYTHLEITVIILSGPLYLSIGLFLGLLTYLFGKKGAIIGIILVFSSLSLFFLGALNESWFLLSQITPYYYFDPVRILFKGVQIQEIVSIIGFVLISVTIVIIRMKKEETKYQTFLSYDKR